MKSNSLQLYRKFILTVLAGVLLMSFFLPAHTQAAIPYIINFQGKITNSSNGTNVADGNYGMQFKIYDAATNGNLLWTETWDATTTQVSIANGVFNVKLGSINSLATVDFTGGTLYLSMNFSANGGTTYDGEMAPRKQLVSAPYAFNASNLVGVGRIAVTATSATTSAATITYNPDSSTSTPAMVLTASSNVTGPALKVVQNGSGSAAIFSGGSVGIGSSTPGALLSLQGTAGATDLLRIASSSGITVLNINAAGNVGIGSTTPNATLTVEGTSTSPTLDVFRVASSTSSVLFDVLANGNIKFATTTSSQILETDANNFLTSAASLGISLGGTGTTTAGSAGTIAYYDGTTLRSSLGGTYYQVLRSSGSGAPAFDDIKNLLSQGTGISLSGTSTIAVASGVINNVSTGTLGSSFNVSTGTNTLIINLPNADSTHSGQLLSGDWTTFNGKQNALSGGSVGQSTIWTSASALGNGIVIDNGTVAGVNATSTNVAFTIQGISGANNIFNFNTSTKATIVSLTPSGSFTINSSTPNATLVVQGTTTSPALDILRIATSTGQTYLTVNNVGSTTALTLSAANLTNGNCVQAATGGVLTTSSGACAVGLSGGHVGQSTIWTSASALGNGIIADNGTVAGVNATSSTINFEIQGTGASNPFQVNSSTGISLLTVNPNGSIAIGTTTNLATLEIQGTSTLPGLDLFRVASSTGILALQITSLNNIRLGTTTASQMLLTDSGNNVQSLAMGGDATLNYTNGNLTLATANSNVGTFGSSGQLVQATANAKGLITAIASVIPTISTSSSGSLFYLATSTTNLFSLNVPINLVNNVSTGTLGTNFNISTTTNGSSNSLVINLPNASNVNSGQLLFGDWTTFNNKLGGTAAANEITYYTAASTTAGTTNFEWYPTAQQFSVNSSTPYASVTLEASTTQATADILRVATSSGFTYLTVTGLGSTTVQTLSAANLTNGNCVQAAAGGLLTTTGGACGGGGLSGGHPGQVAYWTSASALGNGFLEDNGTVAGAGATSTNVAFTIQGISGNNNPFNINSSTGVSLLAVSANGSLGIGTTTNTSTLTVQGTSTQPTLQVFEVASSSGASLFHVMASGNVGIGTSTPLALLNISPNYNLGVTNATVSRGEYITPLVQSAADFRAFEIASYINTTTQQTIAYTALINATTYATTTMVGSLATTLVNASTLYLNGAPIAGSNATIASSSILSIIGNNTTSKGTTTNAYGLFLTAPSGAANNYAAIFTGGNVGIGLTNPTATLHIQGSGAANLFNINSSTGVSLLAVSANGSVSIGTTTNIATLVVQGTSTLQTLGVANFASSSGQSLMWIGANGRIGIGTSTPLALLNTSPSYNQAVTDTTVTRGEYITPMIQSATDFRAFEIAPYINITTKQTIAYTALINATTYSTSTMVGALATTLVNASTLYLNGAPIAGTNATIASSSILTIIGNNLSSATNKGTTTNAYGLFLTAPTGAANNYAATFLGGNVGIGTSAPVATLSITASSGPVDAFIVSSSTRATSSTEFIVAQTGNVGVGTGTPNALFAVVGMCSNFATSTAASKPVAGRCTDYAEIYPSSEPVDKGDIVSAGQALGSSVSGALIKEASKPYDSAILGVVSTNPATIVEGNSVQLMTGIDYELDPLHPAIALAGRVPVKILPNEVIHVGDYITSSPMPGVGMKAVKAGMVVGQALEDYDPAVNTDPNPTVMVFLNVGFFNGSRVEDLVPGLALDTPDNQAGNAVKILQNFIANPPAASPGEFSEISTDKLFAGVEIVSPGVVTRSLSADSISPSLGGNINLNPAANGSVIIGSGPGQGITFDAAGNASFSGKITANEISANKIEGLQVLSSQLSSLSGQVQTLSQAQATTTLLNLDVLSEISASGGLSVSGDSSFAGNALFKQNAQVLGDFTVSGGLSVLGQSSSALFSVDSLGNAALTGNLTASSVSAGYIFADNLTSQFNAQASSTGDLLARLGNLETAFSQATQTIASLDLSEADISGGLTVNSVTTLTGGLKVDSIGSLGDLLTFTGDTLFFGRPYFNTDTAGFAQINAGQKRVDVTFDNPYLEQPIVNVTITLNATTSTSTEVSQTDLAQNLFDNDIRFVVINKSVNGFSIYLNKDAPQDISFSWTALAVKNAKTFSVISPADSQSAPEQQATPPAAPDVSAPPVAGVSSTPPYTAPTSTPPDVNAQAPDASSTPPDADASSTPPNANTIEPSAPTAQSSSDAGDSSASDPASTSTPDQSPGQ